MPVPAVLDQVLARQDGTVSFRQLRLAGVRPHDVERMLRRRELVRVLPRVYADHTGALSWRQRAWSAVLHAEPAALCLESADEPGPGGPVHVAIDARRRVAAPDGVRVHRVRDLHPQVRWNASPPRLRPEDNLLWRVDVSASRSEAVRLLTDAVGSRRTTAPRLQEALARRSRISDRRWLERVLDDLADGSQSVLEHDYLTRVERAHRLPRPDRRQSVRLVGTGREYRDLEYDRLGVVVELDGRLAHAGWDASGRDAERDLDDLATGRVVVRLRWRQVQDRPCATALRLAAVLRRRGWRGEPVPCGPGCCVPR